MFFNEAMASDTLRLSFWNRFCRAEDSRRVAAEEDEEDEEDAEEEEDGLFSGGHSDLS